MYCIQIEVEHDDGDRGVIESIVVKGVSFGDDISCGFEFDNLADAHYAYDKLIGHQVNYEIEIDFVVTWLGDELPFKEDNIIDSYTFIDGNWCIDDKNRIHISLDDMKTITGLV